MKLKYYTQRRRKTIYIWHFNEQNKVFTRKCWTNVYIREFTNEIK